jgi:hypothetical protein
MLASPLPVYLGCAGLIVGSLGLGAQYLVGGNSVGATNETSEQPLFARSVEEAALPTTPWPSQSPAVAHYGPMVDLLSQPALSPEPTTETSAVPQSQAPAADAHEPAAAPRTIVREVPQQQQTRQSRRTKRARDEARARDDASAATEPAPRDARAEALAEEQPRAQERQRGARQGEATEMRDGRSRRQDRRSRDTDDAEVVDTRSRSEWRRDGRRPREAEPRGVAREEIREPSERVVRGAEPREGFSPFRMFGIFDQR